MKIEAPKNPNPGRVLGQLTRHRLYRQNLNLPIGTKFGNLRIADFVTPGDGPTTILCECVCKNKMFVHVTSLLQGKRTSCGQQGCRTNVIVDRKIVALRHLFAALKRRAKKYTEFSLNFNEFSNLAVSECFYCGDPGGNVYSMSRKNIPSGEFSYNGVDRQDSLKGYTAENCVACCGACNTCKMDYSVDQFIQRVHKIAGRFPISEVKSEVNTA